jgi:multicomponent Na+:H+ antiporter subunit G
VTIGILLDWSRAGIGGLCILAGAVLMLGAVLGMLRFPDVFTRLHAASGAMSFGVCTALFGLFVLSGSFLIAAKLAFLIVLIAALTPVLSHVVGSAAHAAGASPIVGAYAAPRPGARGQ